jgi:hypothetical protein
MITKTLKTRTPRMQKRAKRTRPKLKKAAFDLFSEKAVAGFVYGLLSFAMIGMTSEQMEEGITPLRRVFVKGLHTFPWSLRQGALQHFIWLPVYK